MKFFALRVYPNGEFGIGYVKRFQPSPVEAKFEAIAEVRYSWVLSELQGLQEAVGVYGALSTALKKLCPGLYEAIMSEILSPENSDPKNLSEEYLDGSEGDSPLGLSNAINSHKRAKRGSHGLTSHAKRMLRNGAWLLEKMSRRGGVGMITCTIPGCDKNTQRQLVAGWSEILRIFTQWLSRKLKVAGSKNPGVFGVTEIQLKRQEKEGGLPLHLHLVFGSKAGRAYIVSKSDVENAWKRACCSVVSSAENLQWNASTRVEVVKKSVTHYLCKYLSKGSPEAMQRAESEGFKLPSAWWFMVGKLKRQIFSMVGYYTDERASTIWALAHSNPDVFDYTHKVMLEREGKEFAIGIAGKMSQQMVNWCKKFAKSPDFYLTQKALNYWPRC